MNRKRKLSIGLDCSTQSFSAHIIDAGAGETVLSESVNFGRELPQYGAPFGYRHGAENRDEVCADPLMWLDGLDMLFAKISKKIDLSEVVAICGSGQQHAAVYLSSADVFSGLDAARPLSEQVAPHLSRKLSPIWMDVSTARECIEITAAAGGESEVLKRTGSVMAERFTGAQIRKFFKNFPAAYERTRRIHLNSSFICSALSGNDAPIDYGDGAGMNLMNLHSKSWDKLMLDATAENLACKLPPLADSDTCAGKVAKYFSEKYGVNPDAAVVAFTGDNPSSLVGTGAMLSGCATISLGTSDTFFAAAKNPSPNAGGHIFGNPAGGFMSLACFRNGSLAREKLKNALNVDWTFFDVSAFENYAPQDDGNMVLPFFDDEISPKLKSNSPVILGDENFKSSKSALIRALIEGQAMNMLVQSGLISADTPLAISLTGGAAKSGGIAQTLANVFGARVARIKADNSAALGAAMRAAKHAENIGWHDLAENFCLREAHYEPNAEAHEIYRKKTARFKAAMRRHYNVEYSSQQNRP